MPRILSLIALVSALGVSRGLADDDPREVIKRALRACGLPADNQAIALSYRYRMTEGRGGQCVLVEALGDSAGTCCRLTLSEKQTRQPLGTIAFVRGKPWMLQDGRVKNLNERETSLWLGMMHVERVLWLLPLLQDRRFRLTSLGAGPPERRAQSTERGAGPAEPPPALRAPHPGSGYPALHPGPLVGVRVDYPGRSPVRLYFDRQTGLLARACFLFDEGDRKLRLVQEFQDYRTHDWGATDEALLRKAGLATDGPSLLTYLREQTPSADRDREVVKLVRQLGDDSFAVRKRAEKALQTAGLSVLPLVRRATHDRDPEIVHRAQKVIEQIGANKSQGLVLAAVRTIARKKPARAAEVLLGYLCTVTGEEVKPQAKTEALAALAAVTYRDGEPDPVLVKALDGPNPARACAAAALGDDGGTWFRQPGRRLYLPRLKLAHRMVVREEDGKENMFQMFLESLEAFNALPEKMFSPK